MWKKDVISNCENLATYIASNSGGQSGVGEVKEGACWPCPREGSEVILAAAREGSDRSSDSKVSL